MVIAISGYLTQAKLAEPVVINLEIASPESGSDSSDSFHPSPQAEIP
jgi:hypothetical protein